MRLVLIYWCIVNHCTYATLHFVNTYIITWQSLNIKRMYPASPFYVSGVYMNIIMVVINSGWMWSQWPCALNYCGSDFTLKHIKSWKRRKNIQMPFLVRTKQKIEISFDSNNDKPYNTPQSVIYHHDLDVWWHDAAKILPKY